MPGPRELAKVTRAALCCGAMGMGLWRLLLIVVVLIGVLTFVVPRDRAIIDCLSGSGSSGDGRRAQEILQERYARAEIRPRNTRNSCTP